MEKMEWRVIQSGATGQLTRTHARAHVRSVIQIVLLLNTCLPVIWWSISYVHHLDNLLYPLSLCTTGIASIIGSNFLYSAALEQRTLTCTTTYLSCPVIRCNHENCFSKRQGSLFTCPRNDMFSEQGLVEYECWEHVDVIKQMWNQQQVQGWFQLFPEHFHSIAFTLPYDIFYFFTFALKRYYLTKLTSSCTSRETMG